MSKSMNIQLLIVDPQNDFCDPKGSLFVKGGDSDMSRLAKMVHRVKDKLDEIHVTLDSHHYLDISHPTMFKRCDDGAQPTPFTVLGLDSRKKIVKCNINPDGSKTPTTEEYVTARMGFMGRVMAYLEALDATKRYPHVIWPLHCLIGSWGANITPELLEAIHAWEARIAKTNYVTKGSNIFTEHFSGVKAEVPDPEDPSTQINTGLIQTLETADIIAIAGEARSHCVANTVRDIADCFSDQSYVQKLVLLSDATSDVGGFEFLGDGFVKDLTAKGMKLSTTTDFLA